MQVQRIRLWLWGIVALVVIWLVLRPATIRRQSITAPSVLPPPPTQPAK